MKETIQLFEGELIADVKGFEGRFLITSHGRLFSINGRYKGLKELSPCVDCLGYKATKLRMYRKIFRVRLHTLVAEHFCKKQSHHNCVNHLDGNKLNNNASNLEWTTLGDNVRHAVSTGLFDTKGEKHHNSKLTKEKVIEMRRLYSTGNYTQEKIGNMFGVCRRQAGDVINKVNWGWL
jgi:hypothetical protein